MISAKKPSRSIESIRQYAVTLGECLHDVRHEDAGQYVAHYWDDDSLYLPIRGVLAFDEDIKQATLDRLTQSLFSAGYLGPVRLLSAHRSELLGQLAKWSHRQPSDASLQKIVEDFLDRAPAKRVLSVLTEIGALGEDRDSHPEKDVRKIVKELAALEPDSFSIVEASWGGWTSRLAQLLEKGLLSLDPTGPDPVNSTTDPLFDYYAEEISRQRHGARSLATALDAAALTSLAHICEDVREGKTTELPRFFTSSRNLQSLFRRNGSWRRDFHYTYEEAGQVRVGYAWRDSRYYYMRSLYPALRIDGRLREDVTGEPTFDTLEMLHRELLSALESGSTETLELIAEYSLPGDHTLAKLIDDFESHQMAELWLQYSQHEEIPERLNGLVNLAEFGAASVTRKVVGRIERRYLRNLEKELADRALSIRVIDAVNEASSNFEHARWGDSLSLNEDLGSIRWGLLFEPAEDRVTLRPQMQSGYGHAELLKLYSVSYLVSEGRQSERAVAVLIGLEEFDLADRLLKRISTTDSEAIYLMRMVATIGRRGHRSEGELARAAALLQSRWKQLTEGDHRADAFRFAMGYGYLGYKIWTLMMEGGAWFRSSRSGRHDLLTWSLEIVRSALDEVVERPDAGRFDLWIAYAVNHLVFVSVKAGFPPEQVESMATGLERVAVKMDNYRFLDTVGCFLVRQSEEYLGGGEGERQHAVSLLERALNHLDRACRLASADLELRQHRDDARARLLKVVRDPEF